MKHNDMAAWHFDLTAPSILTTNGDQSFKANATGLTRGQIASQAVARKTKKTGRSPGSIYGLSARGNALIEMRRGRG